MQYDLISCDIWDTVIRRRVHPDEIKLATSRKLLHLVPEFLLAETRDEWSLFSLRLQAETDLHTYFQINGADGEYTFDEVYAHVLRTACPTLNVEHCFNLIKELKTFEISFEMSHIYLDDSILSLLHSLSAQTKIIYLSDYYHSADVINGYLRHIGINHLFSEGYVSCDVRRSKRSGAMYKWLYELYNLAPSLHIHIGDNIHSDVHQARRNGSQAIHYNPTSSNHVQKRIYQAWEHRLKYHTVLPNQVTRWITQTEHNSESHMLAIIAVGFCMRVASFAEANNISTLFFLTREGIFLRQVFLQLQVCGVISKRLDARLLHVSRVTTFAPSVSWPLLSSFMRIWNLYSNQTLSALFMSLGIATDSYMHLFSRYNLNPHELYIHPWVNPDILALLIDPEFESMLFHDISQKRADLLSYLDSVTFPNMGSTMLIDIGWRGTMQDNLAYLFPDLHIYGVYLGLMSFLNPQPHNTTKIAYGPNLNLALSPSDHIICKHVEVLELLCNSADGTVISYDNTNHHQPILSSNLSETSTYRTYTSAVQIQSLRSVVALAERIFMHTITPHELHQSVNHALYNLVTNPSCNLARAYFTHMHDERFGLGQETRPLGGSALYTGDGDLIDRMSSAYKVILGSSWSYGSIRLIFGNDMVFSVVRLVFMLLGLFVFRGKTALSYFRRLFII